MEEKIWELKVKVRARTRSAAIIWATNYLDSMTPFDGAVKVVNLGTMLARGSIELKEKKGDLDG